MARILVSFDELKDALDALPVVEVGGVPHLDGEELLCALERLVPFRSIITAPPAREPGVSSRADLRVVAETQTEGPSDHLERQFDNPHVDHGTPTLEGERARLAALPPGPCVGCGQPQAECPCDTYIDSTVRDPIEVARDAMMQGADAPSWWEAGMVPASAGIMPAISMHEGNMFAKPAIRDAPPVDV